MMKRSTILLLAILLAAALLATATASPLPWTHKHRSSLIKNFEVATRIDPSLRRGVEAAIAASKSHNPTNGTDPWTIQKFLSELEDYLYFTGTPETPRYGPQFGQTLNSAVWTQHPTAVQFVHDFQVARGIHLRSPTTIRQVKQWVLDPAINISQYVIPEGGFQSFQDFFTRNLAPGARPVAAPEDDSVIVSPVDATVLAEIATIDSPDFLVKGLKGGMPINVTQLVGNKEAVLPFIGGKGLILSLAVTDYHRWHSPTRGHVDHVSQLGNMYWCTPPGTSWFPDMGYYFRRSPIVTSTPAAATPAWAGGARVLTVPVGIAEYGSVIPYVAPGDSLETKGELFGQFDLGGSMVFLAFDAAFDVDIVVASNTHVKVGQAVAKLVRKKDKK